MSDHRIISDLWDPASPSNPRHERDSPRYRAPPSEAALAYAAAYHTARQTLPDQEARSVAARDPAYAAAYAREAAQANRAEAASALASTTAPACVRGSALATDPEYRAWAVAHPYVDLKFMGFSATEDAEVRAWLERVRRVLTGADS